MTNNVDKSRARTLQVLGGDVAEDTPEKEKRSTRQPKDILPEQQRLQARWEARNDADHVGNIGWLFGNWGRRPRDREMRDHVDEVLKKQPAMVIGLAECQKETEMVLQQGPAAVAAAPKAQATSKFTSRPEFQYLTFRGKRRKQRPHCSARSGWLRPGLAERGEIASRAHQKEMQHGKSFGILSQHHREGHLAA